ncbi:hypothetical protein BDA96_09G141000 [Sorghum bicolor]|uniref:Inosine/uridine-preferring nucleoside hydrolase domain-containing protein n=1 Tax=Sorghum bicolor TaxID=4558 RepID=A0A921U450_SORBI|nr:hypothetical protein BDA96_09G141000 [Sorghum bicolor]
MERWRMEKMLPPARRTTVAFLMALVTTTVVFAAVSGGAAEAAATPHRILVDTDMDTDDLLALLYILKQNRSEFDLKAGSKEKVRERGDIYIS